MRYSTNLQRYIEIFNGHYVVMCNLKVFNPHSTFLFSKESECIIFTIGNQNFIIHYSELIHSYTFYELDNTNKVKFITTRTSKEIEIFDREVEDFIHS